MPPVLDIERLVAGGEALAREASGRIVFVRGGLPGERVAVEFTSEKKDFARAVVVDVLDAAPERRTPPCPHRHEGCGGCDWMHIDTRAQLVAKTEIVRESLRRVGRLPEPRIERLIEVGAAVEPVGYRTTVRVAGDDDGRVGFRQEGSDELVPITECRTAHPRLVTLLDGIRLDPAEELTLRTSVATGESTAWSSGGAVSGLSTTVHTGKTAALDERVAGRLLRVSAGSFFQSGPQAAELLVDAVTRAAGDHAMGHVVDAYGGVGLFAATSLSRAEQVTVVESAALACDDAVHNLAGRAAQVVRREVGHWKHKGPPPDLVVADPARQGLGRAGVAALAAARPDAMVLVSCDPVSMARDASLLEDAGYHATNVEVLDLFPETHHVETVTRFAAASVR